MLKCNPEQFQRFYRVTINFRHSEGETRGYLGFERGNRQRARSFLVLLVRMTKSTRSFRGEAEESRFFNLCKSVQFVDNKNSRCFEFNNFGLYFLFCLDTKKKEKKSRLRRLSM